MAKGIDVSVASDTRAFATGVKSGMIEPLQHADDTLKGLAETGQASGDALEHTFREQQTATEKLKSEIGQLNTQIKEGSRSSFQQMGQHGKTAAHEVDEGLKEMKDSAKQNSIQTAASFNGSFDSIAGGAQGLVSEFAAGFGPAGLIAGMVGAGGIGLLTQAIDSTTQATQADKQAVADLATQYIDAGTKGKRAFDDVHTAIENMATSTDGSAIITLQEAWDKAKIAGADYQDIVKSIALSDPASIQRALDKVNELRGSYQGAVKGAADYANDPNASLRPKIDAADALGRALEKAKGQATGAARAQELAAEAGLSEFQLKADAVHQVHDAYASAAGEVDKYRRKESGLFETGAYIKAMERRRHELEQYRETLSKSALSASAKSYIESLGEDTAATYMAGYAKATPKQRAQLDAIWTTAGHTNAQSYGDALGKRIQDIKAPAPQITRPVVPAPDTSKLDAFLRQPKVARVTVEAYTPNGRRIL